MGNFTKYFGPEEYNAGVTAKERRVCRVFLFCYFRRTALYLLKNKYL